MKIIELPVWIILTSIFIGIACNTEEGLQLHGDLRFRLGYIKNQDAMARTRKRIRFRLNGDHQVSEYTRIYFGLATGSSNPRSTKQTVGDTFQRPEIRLDYVYIDHIVTQEISLLAGKVKNPIWRPSNLLWDSDIRPDGIVGKFQSDKGLRAFALGGYFILDEIKDKIDPGLAVFQAGIHLSLNTKLTMQTALSAYFTHHAKGLILNQNKSHTTNTQADTGGLEDEFYLLALSTRIDLNNPLNLPPIAVFNEAIININKSGDNKGIILGVVIGDKKVNTFGDWQTYISYRYLQPDSWLDFITNSDSYHGETDSEGIDLVFRYGVSKAMTVGLNIYSMDKISTKHNRQVLIQLDFNVKF